MKKRLLCVVLSLIFLLSALIIRVAVNYSTAFDEFAENSVKSHVKLEINKIISQNINSGNIQIDEITNVNRTSDGRIISISINSLKLNTFLLMIEENILIGLNKTSVELGMPLGNLTGMRALSGKGPKITVDILPTISISQQPNSELLSSGINQTLHRVTSSIETEIKCIAPFYTTKCKIRTTLIISETLIVGEIPEIILSPIE